MDTDTKENNTPSESDFLQGEDGVIKCPKCKKELVAKDLKKTVPDVVNGRVLKSRLVFFQEDGTILGKCGGCGKMVGLPFRITSEENLPKTV